VLPLSRTLDAAFERASLETWRPATEALREHYGPTLHAWVDNLPAPGTTPWTWSGRPGPGPGCSTWRALAFEQGRITVHQVLAVRRTDSGASAMPTTRNPWFRMPSDPMCGRGIHW
jgi:cyclopropane-fatty-acyl-phospholipid synthase